MLVSIIWSVTWNWRTRTWFPTVAERISDSGLEPGKKNYGAYHDEAQLRPVTH